MKRFLLALIALSAGAQQTRVLTVDWIMQGPALYGHAPQNVRWSRDSGRVYFEWRKHDSPLRAENDTYVVGRDGQALRKLSEDEAKHAPPMSGVLAKDKSYTVFAEGGDIYLYDHAAMQRRALTRTAEIESNPRFHKDSKQVAFQRGMNLYLLSLEDGSLTQLTDIRPAGAAPGGPPTGRGAAAQSGEQKGTDSQEFIKKEERELLATIADRAKKREETEAKRKKENPRKPWTLAARQSVTLMLTPDGERVIAQVTEAGDRSKSTIVPNYVTESAYTEDIPARNKVGDSQATTRVAIVKVDTGDQIWADHGIKDRAVQLTMPQFNDDGTKAFLRARAADNKDQWLLALDVATGKTRALVNMHDEAWVGFFGLTAGFLPDDRVYFLWERDGYSHLYTVPFGGGEPKQLTSGKWEIRQLALSDDKKLFYISSAEASPYENHLYAMSVDGGDRKRMTTKPGGHNAIVSPDGSTVASVYSYSDTPPELWVGNRKITTSPSPEFSSYPWSDPPIVEIPARDGAKVPARIYKPEGFKKGGPLVVFVHGAGYMQNVHRQWSSYSREYMFHHLLRDRGYLVLDIDYRASAGYGRDWRTGIYRFMGGKDLDDHVDAVQWAIKEHGVDPKRVGIYGGSYGGFITLMALFTQPEVFQAGAALRPVTDWAHYNHGYTSNILNTPQKDREAYTKSSPIYHAAGLKGHLLIAHGMVDVNVHYQDSVRLVQKLIELRKENWEFASYPVEDHGFVEPASWADEYKRILKLFDSTIGKPVEPAAASKSAPKKK